VLVERRMHCEQRRRKVQTESDDVIGVATEERNEFERLRTELIEVWKARKARGMRRRCVSLVTT
jgi:hypothetical protein